MDSILNKIKSNNLLALTQEELDIVASNADLKSLFLSKVKEGCLFDESILPEELGLALFTTEYIVFYLENIRMRSTDSFLDLFINGIEDVKDELDSYDSGLYDIMVKYYKEHKEEIIELFIKSENKYRVSNRDIIGYIIRHNLGDLAGYISIENPSKDVEDFIIRNLDHCEVVHTFSERILEACIAIGNPFLLKSFYKRSELLEKALLDAANSGQYSYDEFDYDFIGDHKNDPGVVKLLINKGYYFEIPEGFFDKHPEVISHMVECLRNGTISYVDSKYYKYPEIFATLLYIAKDPSSIQEYLVYHREEFVNAVKKVPNLVVEAIDNYIKNNVSDGIRVIRILYEYYSSSVDLSVFNSIVDKVFSQLTFEQYLEYKKNYNTYYTDNSFYNLFYKKIEEIEFTVISIPEGFDFKAKHPKWLLLKIIPLMNFDQLDPNVVSEHFFEDEELSEAVLVRLAQLKSNKFNSSHYLFNGLTPKMVDIILSKENPLNLTPSQILNFIPNDTGRLKQEYLIPIIERAQILTTNDVQAILNIIFAREFDEVTGRSVYKSSPEKIKVFVTLLSSNKLELDYKLYNILGSFFRDFINTYNNDEMSDKDKQVLYDVCRKFLSDKKEVPLHLTVLFDEELRKSCTYDFASLALNTDLFNIVTKNYDYKNYPKDFILFIKRALDKGVTFNIELFYKLLKDNVVSKDDLVNVNLCYNDANDIANTIIDYISNYYPECINAVINWMNTMDISSIINKRHLFNSLITHEEFLGYIIEKSKRDSSIEFNGNILNILITSYEKGFFNEAKMFVFNVLKNNKVNLINDDIICKYLDLPYPEVQEFFIEKFFKVDTNYSFLSDVNVLVSIYKNKNYYNVIVNRLKRHPEYLRNYLSHIVKYKELKDIYIAGIKSEKISIKNLYITGQEYFDKEILETILELRPDAIQLYISYLVHYGYTSNNNIITPETYDVFRSFIPKQYNIQIECFDELAKLYGYNTLKLLDNLEIVNLLGKDLETVHRFVEILKVRKLDIKSLEAINDSIQQHIYTVKNPEEINIFTNICERIQNGISEEDIIYYIELLCKKDEIGNYIYLPKDLVFNDTEETNKDLVQIHNDLIHSYRTMSKEEFLRMLFVKIRENQNIYIPVLNQITNSFLSQRRVEIMRNEDIYTDTGVSFTYDTKQLRDAKFKYLLKIRPNLLKDTLDRANNKGDVSKKQRELDILTIDYLIGNTDGLNSDQIAIIKRNIRIVKEKLVPFLDEYSEEWIEDEYLVGVRKYITYEEREPDVEDIKNINFKVIYSVLEDKDKYDCLIKILDKYKILEWDGLFDDAIRNLCLGESNPDLYNFINAFNSIYESEMRIMKKARKELIDSTVQSLREAGESEEKIEKYIEYKENEPYEVNLNAFKILKYATIYSAISNCYKIILGLEDYNLVKSNPTPNAATRGNQEQRLDRDCEIVIDAIQNDKITIPSFVKTYEYEDKDQAPLQVIVGCRGDRRNITMGERTGACMRAYGHAIELFELCCNDPRGFHITFQDPSNGQFISRISGFRNGNTVFLNQLRFSLDSKKYPDQLIRDTLYNIARELIERSKDSEMPIENVVTSPTYSMEGYETQLLSERDISAGIFTGWRDVSDNAVVLATVGKKGQAVPLKLDPYNQPTYKPCRMPLRTYSYPGVTDEIKILMQRVDAIKVCIEQKDTPDYYKSIDFDFELLEKEYAYAIIGQDFYVALDMNGNIVKNIAIQDERALEEFNNAIIKVEEYKQSSGLVGGMSNGLL